MVKWKRLNREADMILHQSPDPIPPGSRWLELDSNRVVVIDGYPNSLWWHYEDDPAKTSWTCCVEDFFIWNRFRRLT